MGEANDNGLSARTSRSRQHIRNRPRTGRGRTVIPGNGSLGQVRSRPRIPPHLWLAITTSTGRMMNPYPLLRSIQGLPIDSPATRFLTESSIVVRADVLPHLQEMLRDAARAGFMLQGGGYRSPDVQLALRRAHCGPSPYETFLKPPAKCTPPTAYPDTNAHSRGLAVDFTVEGRAFTVNTPAHRWLLRHASSYFFHQTRPEEPWRWEFQPAGERPRPASKR